jgi:hypothetical protein
MTRTFGLLRLGVSLAIVMLGAVGFATSVRASPPPNAVAVTGTPLPPGWEQCILEGIGASPTPEDVANLDEWQVVEGGSTNNAAAYNPFNVRQVTDSSGAPLPAVMTSGGFPAFPTWPDGCAATVATLLQPSMVPIVTALRAGNIAVPGIFLYDVDQSPWCAPSADGIPCYASEILAGEIVETLVSGSSGQLKGSLTSYSNTGSDLKSYEEDAYVTASEQNVVAAKNAMLVSAQQAVTAARGTLARATSALRRLALDDYTDDAASRFESSLPLLGSPDQRDTIGQFFRGIAASLLTDHWDEARAGVKASISKRRAAQASLAQATAVLDATQNIESQALSGLEADAKGIEAGLACPAPPLVTAAASPVDSQDGAAQLWGTLQDCLAPTLQLVSPTDVAATS